MLGLKLIHISKRGYCKWLFMYLSMHMLSCLQFIVDSRRFVWFKSHTEHRAIWVYDKAKHREWYKGTFEICDLSHYTIGGHVWDDWLRCDFKLNIITSPNMVRVSYKWVNWLNLGCPKRLTTSCNWSVDYNKISSEFLVIVKCNGCRIHYTMAICYNR